MCGIVGIIGRAPVAPLLLEGLRRLEYRGYDSAGIATLADGAAIDRRRAEGKLVNLERVVAEAPIGGTLGIAHTRWATHGGPTTQNAHPHTNGQVAVVHNGIIENYRELKAELQARQHRFQSETDTEILVHLIADLMQGGLDPVAATGAALKRVQGAFAFVALFAGHPDLLVGARSGPPLAVGFGDGEMFLGSDALALAPLTTRICYLEDGDWVELRRTGVTIRDADDRPVERKIIQTSVSGALIGKGEFRHFMLKEIFEQPKVISDTLTEFVSPETGRVYLPDLPFDLGEIPRLTAVACGTAFYAAWVGKYWLETLARLPVEIDVASEFRYREAPMPPGGAALFVSQSGETADTLAALRYARQQNQAILSIINVPESTIARESDAVLYTRAGPEVGVASTKAFTTQLTVLACVAIAAARARRTVAFDRLSELAEALRGLPGRIAEVLRHDQTVLAIARDIAEARDVLYLGRGSAHPLALEGALKLKEVSYIHAEGYAAGEMKHGPIALIDEAVPVIVVAPHDGLFEKTASNCQEVAARGGKVLLMSDAEGIAKLGDVATWTLELPTVDPFVAPILYALPIQLLAYHVAVLKGTDVDQPRNLAKSVTVE